MSKNSNRYRADFLKSPSKGLIFILAGLIAVLATFFCHFFYSTTSPTAVFWSSGVIAILIAYFAERLAQHCARVRLRWGGLSRHRLSVFLLYLVIWIFSLYFSIEGLDSPKGYFGLAVQVFVIYMFAAAFFEMLNLLKTGGKK
mgnify:CR=1 FL=1